MQRKEIPLYVKSFLNPENTGTTVGKDLDSKPKSALLYFKTKSSFNFTFILDFSYIVEDNISHIFSLLHEYKMKVSMIQNSAISFSVCIENNYDNLDRLVVTFKGKV